MTATLTTFLYRDNNNNLSLFVASYSHCTFLYSRDQVPRTVYFGNSVVSLG